MSDDDTDQTEPFAAYMERRLQERDKTAVAILMDYISTVANSVGLIMLPPAMLTWFLDMEIVELMSKENLQESHQERLALASNIKNCMKFVGQMEESKKCGDQLRNILSDFKEQATNDLLMRPGYDYIEDMTYGNLIPAPIKDAVI